MYGKDLLTIIPFNNTFKVVSNFFTENCLLLSTNRYTTQYYFSRAEDLQKQQNNRGHILWYIVPVL